MDEKTLQAIEERANASRGPWKVKPSDSPESTNIRPLFKVVGSGSDHAYTVADGMLRDNAIFIAHARSDIPALVEEVRRLRDDGERLAKVADALNAYHNGSDPDGGLCIQQIAAALGKPF
jgi:hypothetical protein